MTFPEPSQIEFSGESRSSRGITDSSTKPLPPRHSRPSAATGVARLHTQNFATAVATRWNNGSVPGSYARANRIARSVAASDSMQRSARTFNMSGCSISGAPKADRYAAWWVASATARRIVAAEPSTQSSRVWLTISMIVRTPRPSSPTNHARAASNSTSLEARARVPSLSFSRWIRNPEFRDPSGRTRGSRKHDRPPGACARTRNASHIGWEQNHLCPVSSYAPPPTGSARVVFALTSEPPRFSVIAMPHRAARAGSSSSRRGSHSAASSGFARSAGIDA